MTREPLVTIITPCYNHEKYLDDYFRGLLSQTYSRIQLILVDDSSTDGSWSKVQEYAPLLRKKFPLVQLESHPNIGPTQEILRVAPHIEGEFFTILESDDYYLPTKVEQNVRYLLDHPEAGAVHSDLDFLYGRRIERRHWRATGKRVPSGDVFEDLLGDNFIWLCTFLCRTELFRRYGDFAGYIAKGYLSRDYALYLDLARHSHIGYIDEPLARYRFLRESFSHSQDLQRAFEFEQKMHQVKLDYVEKYGGSERARSLAIEGKHQALFIYGFRMRRVEQCLEAYEWLLRHNPRRYGALPFRILAKTVSSPAWRVVRAVERSPLVQEAALRLFSLRNRAQNAP